MDGGRGGWRDGGKEGWSGKAESDGWMDGWRQRQRGEGERKAVRDRNVDGEKIDRKRRREGCRQRAMDG